MPSIREKLSWLLGVVRRRKAVVLFLGLLIHGSAGVYLLTATPLYRAEAKLQVEPENGPAFNREESYFLGLRSLRWNDYMGTQLRIITGREIADTALSSLPEPLRTRWRHKRDPAGLLSSQLQAETVPETYLIRIRYVTEDREEAAPVLDAVVKAYVDSRAGQYGATKRSAAGELSAHTLPELQRALQESAAELDSFLAQDGNSELEQRHAATLERWRKVNERLGAVRLQRLELTSRQKAFEDARQVPEQILAVPDARDSETIRELRRQEMTIRDEFSSRAGRLRTKHPERLALEARLQEIRQGIDAEIARIISGVTAQLNEARHEEELLLAESAALEETLAALRKNLFQLNRLKSKVDTAQKTYDLYYGKYGEANATADVRVANVGVHEYPRAPQGPFYPNWPFGLAMAFMLFVVASVGLLLLLERLDDTIHAQEPPETYSGLEPLTVIPAAESIGVDGPRSRPLADIAGPGLEAFRRLRSDMTYRLMSDPNRRVVALLSPMAGEGKTTVAVRLAEVFAMADKKVLLLEADLRRPNLHHVLGNVHAADLEKLLTREADPEAVITPARYGRFDVACVARSIPNPTELLAGAPVRDLLDYARQQYDVVIVDTPPLLLTADAAIMAKQADLSLLVLRHRVSRRQHVVTAMRELKGLGLAPAGIVLNAVASNEALSYSSYYHAEPRAAVPSA
ncbi:MAG: polysaccharide biosynthesis tyrosine autokinase [Planctomycetes bacterium]|nr:polysaccharide biosynthesis tyrosine autokinase [Planctomycetota bacterium]